MEFTVTIIDPCSSTTISLTDVVPNLAPSYTLGNTANDLEFDTSKTNDGTDGTIICPDFIYTLTYESGDALDPNLFTFDSTVSDEKLTTVSQDRLLARAYTLRLTAKYNDARYTH